MKPRYVLASITALYSGRRLPSISNVTGDGLADIATTWFDALYVLPHAQ